MKKTISFLLVCLTFLTTEDGYSQVPDSCKKYQRLPLMFVEKDSAAGRNDGFSRRFGGPSKHETLSKFGGAQEKILRLSKKAMDSFVSKVKTFDGVVIHFARYSKNRSEHLPGSLPDKKLILLFSNQTKLRDKVEYYYLNSPDGIIYKVPNVSAERWIATYINSDIPALRIGLVPKDPENLIDTTQPWTIEKSSDTRSISYTKEEFIEAFETEIKYQLDKNNRRIEAYQVSFSSYLPYGRTLLKPDDKSYKLRLLIQIDYMVRSESNDLDIFPLEKDENFTCRYLVWKAYREANKFALNNGHLCPINCPNDPPPAK